MNFKKWLETLIEEKGLENEIFTIDYEGEFHMIEMQFLVEFLGGMDKRNQDKIKNILVMIDFKNGDVMDFMNHCARGYVETYQYLNTEV
jgi:hypothetical protein